MGFFDQKIDKTYKSGYNLYNLIFIYYLQMLEKPQDILPIKPKGTKPLSTNFDNDKFLEAKNKEILDYNIKVKGEISELKNDINVWKKDIISSFIDSGNLDTLLDIKKTLWIKNDKELKLFFGNMKNYGISTLDLMNNRLLFKEIHTYATEMFNFHRKDSASEILLYFYKDIAKVIKLWKKSIVNLTSFLRSNTGNLIAKNNIYTLWIYNLSTIIDHPWFYDIVKFLNNSNNSFIIWPNNIDLSKTGINFIKLIQQFIDKLWIKDYDDYHINIIMNNIINFFNEKLKIKYNEVYLYSWYEYDQETVLSSDIQLFDFIKNNENWKVRKYFWENDFIHFISDIDKIKSTNRVLIICSYHGRENWGWGTKSKEIFSQRHRDFINNLWSNVDVHYEACFANINNNVNNNINFWSVWYFMNNRTKQRIINSYISSDLPAYDYNLSNKHNYREAMIDRILYDKYSIWQIWI